MMAVERPPIGNNPKNRENGFEKVESSGVICIAYWRGPHGEFRSGTDATPWWNRYLVNDDIGHLYGGVRERPRTRIGKEEEDC